MSAGTCICPDPIVICYCKRFVTPSYFFVWAFISSDAFRVFCEQETAAAAAARPMGQFESVALGLVLIFAHYVDSTRDVDETNGHQVVMCAILVGVILVGMLMVFPSQRGTLFHLLTALPAITACIMRLLHTTVPQPNAASYWRLVLSWGMVVAAIEVHMRYLGIARSERIRNLAGCVVGHLALIPRVCVAGTGVSEATKITGFLVALITGALLPYAVERALKGLDLSEARARRAEDRAAHHKQALLDQSVELAEALTQLRELRHTANALLDSHVELQARRRTLAAHIIQQTTSSTAMTAEVRAALQDSDSDGGDSDEDDARSVSPVQVWAVGNAAPEQPPDAAPVQASDAGPDGSGTVAQLRPGRPVGTARTE